MKVGDPPAVPTPIDACPKCKERTSDKKEFYQFDFRM